ncbi:MAG: hypothetical protein R3236_09520, partial [Phycisphaeraceae bacterium]|nr:hypothetical protein [Phycisphaeraceae bacterium]
MSPKASSRHQKSRSPKRLLVAAWGPCAVRAAVVEVTDAEVFFAALASSDRVDPAEALEEATAKLSAQTRMPRDGVLVIAHAPLTPVELPVSPDRPLDDAEMTDLARWQILSRAEEWSVTVPIGAILRSRSGLTAQDSMRIATSDHARGKRFGEVAVAAGAVREEQVETALAVQQATELSPGEHPVIGLLPLREDPGESAGQHAWLTAALDRTMRDRWVSVFARQGVRLKNIYPSVGLGPQAYTQLPNDQATAAAAMRLRPHALQVTMVSEGRMDQATDLPLSDGQVTLEACLQTVWPAQIDDLYLTDDPGLQQVADDLAERLGAKLHWIQPQQVGEQTLPAAWHYDMTAAARHAAGQVPTGTALAVTPKEPRPPIRK